MTFGGGGSSGGGGGNQRSREAMPFPVYTYAQTFQAGNGYTLVTGNATLSQETTDVIIFDECLKLVLPGDGVRNDLRKDPETAFDTTSADIAILVKCSDWSKVSFLSLFIGQNIGLQWEFGAGSLLLAAGALPNNEWCWLSLNFSEGFTAGAPTRTGIDWVQLSIIDDNTDPIDFQWQALATLPQKANGVIIITFDDGYDNTFLEGFKYLNRYGFKAVEAPIFSGLGTPGFMTVSQILQMQTIGWDIVWHGTNTPSWSTLTQAEMEALIQTDIANFQSEGIKGMNYIFTPGGIHDQDALLATRKYFSVARMYTGINMSQPPAQWNSLYVGAGVVVTDTPASINTRIDDCMTENGLFLLSFHELSSGGGPFQYTVANFRTIIDHINTQGYTVMTLTEFIASL